MAYMTGGKKRGPGGFWAIVCTSDIGIPISEALLVVVSPTGSAPRALVHS